MIINYMKKRKKKNSKNNKKIYLKVYDIKDTITKRYNILVGFIVIIMLVMLIRLYNIQIINHDFYVEKVSILSTTKITGSSAPRGRIYDRNHRLIVDNKPVKTIYYKKKTGVTTKKEIEQAYKMANLIDVNINKLNDNILKNFWLKNNYTLSKEKITDEEWQQYKERKLTNSDIEKLKLERITEEELNSYNDLDKEAAYIYYLMNNGYSYSEKVIKKRDVTDEEYAIVAENLSELDGFNVRLDWEREYLYGDTFRTILGNVSTEESGIPYELKNYYLDKGYSLNDRVGTSYLEYQYEDILKGEKNVYEITNNGTKKLITEGRRGNDIVLTIDIELQKEVERILSEQVLAAKSDPNTKYYNRSFVVITNPNTGEVLAMAGKQVLEVNGEYKVYDYTPGITTSPVVAGSSVKAASQLVGYNTGALKIGEIRDDSCIKIAATPKKCSIVYMGTLNDISAIARSSNTYQFNTAIKVGKGNYKYDKPLVIDKEAFNIYRNTFNEFGLGVKTGIDLPVESLGYRGTSTLPGHLLDFSIGQYDSYTPIQMAQYIATLANGGNRLKPYLLKEVYNPTKDGLTDLKSTTETQVLNTVNTKVEYMNRVKEALRAVVVWGTGRNYMPDYINGAGKTGTSESFIDTDNNGIVDTETVSNTFVGYAPYDNPVMSFVVISPDIYYNENGSSYKTTVNKKIAYEVSKKFFEIYQ